LIRLLADENVPRPSVLRLRAAGIDVTVAPSGASDDETLARAAAENRILVTLDRDFGRLALSPRPQIPPGIVYIRGRTVHPESCGEALLALLRDPAVVLEGRFTVVGDARFRQRALRAEQ
jgi:predicted nuclease of predicted toxin-antitoxin system